MSDAQTPPQPPVTPQQPVPAPAPPYQAPAPAAYPPASYGAPAYPQPVYPQAAYPQPVYPQAGYAPYPPATPTRPVGAPGLGLTALIAAIAAAVVSILLSGATGFAAAEGAMRHAIGLSPEGLDGLTDDQLLALLSPVRDLVLWAEIGLWLGTALGIWALIQGIAAIVTRRGRGQGIAAVVIAALAPFLYAGFVGMAVIAGIAAGAS